VKAFLDTSGFLALLDIDDRYHEQALLTWDRLGEADVELVTSNSEPGWRRVGAAGRPARVGSMDGPDNSEPGWRRVGAAGRPARVGSMDGPDNYVVLETNAIVQRRLGMAALRAFTTDVLASVTVAWLDRELHERATAAQIVADRRRLSLVDCTSFLLMRHQGISRAFTFDEHFREQGFEIG
jgi:predicted nucleic acid-binding protein